MGEVVIYNLKGEYNNCTFNALCKTINQGTRYISVRLIIVRES